MTPVTDEPLRIAMLAPVTWPLPPEGYGPWEKCVWTLTEELVARGHKVTLFAAAGSRSSAELVSTVPHPFECWPRAEGQATARLDPASGLLVGPPDLRAWEQLHIATCMEAVRFGTFDVVHSHLHVHALVFSRLIPCPMVSSLHGAAWVKALHPIFDRYRDQPYVALSEAEKQLKPDLHYVATVHNGVRLEDFPLSTEKEDYLLFAGRMSPEKGPAEAIQIARLAGRPLRLAGMIEPQHEEYFNARVRAHLDDKWVTYLGCLSQRELAEQYRRAAAVLFPIHWCEPCSWVGIEAQASGTPIIGTRLGYLPELVRDGETGFLVDTIEQAARAVDRLDEIDPRACRANVEARFSAQTMAEGYEAVFRRLAGRTAEPAPRELAGQPA
ncbi:MAG TPA: glycosyltransferase family 4 protein [Planctomycetaceae bacterium]|nr:glycosyltransferase family 4 protein [Planctomycetaceae bacterium]HIQ22014.1 glycosyltransferase family 4 protein [Planctomycetota bacterium]